ncbi:mechanosensitive ion-channel; protection against hypoosmotic shock [Candidatus Blochmanniella floridana]|uniref:Mechanosensitive ion-channel protection against hypoosmotic shock n=1 Tax=Blochmanniella floridana TaxID=203907 RepID=Q7VQP9_BLOFL|nr:mechanosensitive ion-channel; protection against hypoosmotic shock [Candidatus Blochmannia floridanus]
MIHTSKTFQIIFYFITTYIFTYLIPSNAFSYHYFHETHTIQKLQHVIKKPTHAKINQKSITKFLLPTSYNQIKNQNINFHTTHKYKKIINNFSSYIIFHLQKKYKETNNYIIFIYQTWTKQQLQEKSIIYIHTFLIKYLTYTIAQPTQQYINILKTTTLHYNILKNFNQNNTSFTWHRKLLNNKYNDTYHSLQTLNNQSYYPNNHKKKHITHPIKTVCIKHNNDTLPKSIKNQLYINHELSLIINQQIHDMNNIISKQKEITAHILQVNQTFSNLIEQSQWINKSPALGETLRSQVSELPKIPKFQQLDNDMAQLRAKRLQYANQINKISTLLSYSKQDDGSNLTTFQKNILEKQLNIQHTLIISLLNNYDKQILELTKLKLFYEQLKHALQKIQQATHRYLFWVADIYPITISYPIDIYRDILKLIINKSFHYQIKSAFHMILTHKKTLILTILCIITSLSLHFGIRHHYYEFLERTSEYIGKVNQDNFRITFYNISSSIFMALPIPILWVCIGYNLNHAWPYPIIVAIGDGMNSTVYILWAFIISGYFASPHGLFITHFGWPKKRIQQVFSKHYPWSVTIIISLITTLITINNYNNREFSNTLGRLCFLILCIYLTFITNTLKHSGLPLYLNKYDSTDNIVNRSLWNIMICAPIIAAISCFFGYLFAAQILLIRLEASLFIWILLLIIYHIIRRWMFIQRRRIALERAKKKRATQLILRSKNQPDLSYKLSHKEQFTISHDNNKKSLDLDTISAQSLQLIRSIITLVAVLFMILLWSELRFAFSFLENITLWDVTSTIKGIDNIRPITLNAFLTVIVVIIITTITVRNLPSFLELTLLQYLNLNPGTEYAVIALTKYIIMLLGSLIGLSLIGIEWVKIQWLIAALGVGLGFGLQEIFANFISGLIILFEKPIRIGDTITIKNFTGSITRINTRATIITDWDHKEIIVPNKEFITKQFTNWSLSDTTTRITLRIPAPLKIDSKEITNVFTKIIKSSPLVLKTPPPEVYLIDLQYGFPIFEIRLYTINLKSRVPLRHQINIKILEYYKHNNIELPNIPFYFYKNLSIDPAIHSHSVFFDTTKPIF